jgi:hypothetical protein
MATMQQDDKSIKYIRGVMDSDPFKRLQTLSGKRKSRDLAMRLRALANDPLMPLKEPGKPRFDRSLIGKDAQVDKEIEEAFQRHTVTAIAYPMLYNLVLFQSDADQDNIDKAIQMIASTPTAATERDHAIRFAEMLEQEAAGSDSQAPSLSQQPQKEGEEQAAAATSGSFERTKYISKYGKNESIGYDTRNALRNAIRKVQSEKNADRQIWVENTKRESASTTSS